MAPSRPGTLSKVFGYFDPKTKPAAMWVNIHFTWSPGPEFTFYRAAYLDEAGAWHPIAKGDWLESWCVAALAAADESELIGLLLVGDEGGAKNNARQ